MSVSFGGIGNIFATFDADPGLSPNSLVKIVDNNMVSWCEEDDLFSGWCTEVTGDGHATVQLRGYFEVYYDPENQPSLGICKLACADDLTVAASEDGIECLVINIDETNNTVGLFI